MNWRNFAHGALAMILLLVFSGALAELIRWAVNTYGPWVAMGGTGILLTVTAACACGLGGDE